MPSSKPIRATAPWTVLFGLLALIGCSRGGLSDYQRAENARLSVMERLQSQGVKLKEKNLDVPTYVVDLSGMTITDGLIQQLGELQNLSELNLSKSTITDEHLGQIHDLMLCVRCFKLDLSQTAITDAGIDKLVNIATLNDLYVAGTKVTKAAAERLKTRKQNDKRVPEFLRKAPRVHF